MTFIAFFLGVIISLPIGYFLGLLTSKKTAELQDKFFQRFDSFNDRNRINKR